MMHKHRLLHSSALLVAFALVSPTLRAQGSAVDEASQEQLQTATSAYEQGLQAFEAEKYGEALDQFRQSYAMVNSPNSQLMVGRALVKLGRLTEAYTELRRALQKAKDLAATQKKYEKTVASAQKDLDEIRGKLCYVMLPGGTTAKIQGKSVGPFKEDEPVPVLPGTISIEVTYADGNTQTKEVSLGPGEKTNLPPQTPTATTSQTDSEKSTGTVETSHDGNLGMSRKTLGYIVGGVGVVGIATFVGVGLLGAPMIFGDPKGDCSSGNCSEADMDNQARKSMLQGIGYAGLGMGVVGLGIGAWLVLGADSKTQATTALQVGPGMVQLNHKF